MSALVDRADHILELAANHADEWIEVETKTGVPRAWGMASFERESGSDYSRSPAQGDPWASVSTHVPRGLGPYAAWGSSCIAAYKIDDLETVGKPNWTWARACYEGELYNGFGPRAHGRHTGYLWAWTNVYTGGKYTSDGHWDPDAQDRQCGMVPLIQAIVKLGGPASYALADPSPITSLLYAAEQPAIPAPQLPPLPVTTPGSGPVTSLTRAIGSTVWLQSALNSLDGAELILDGSYGRRTRMAVRIFQHKQGLAVDGLAGPETMAKIESLLPKDNT